MPNDDSRLIEPHWLTLEEAVAINVLVVQATGEPHAVRDKGLLSSALNRPINAFHYEQVTDLSILGARLLLGVARNHPFVQGNKRTAFLAMQAFIGMNNIRLNIGGADMQELAAELIIDAVTGKTSEDDLARQVSTWGTIIDPRPA